MPLCSRSVLAILFTFAPQLLAIPLDIKEITDLGVASTASPHGTFGNLSNPEISATGVVASQSINQAPECGAIGSYLRDTPKEWAAARTDAWLDEWWHDNQAGFNRTGGFAQSLGWEYLRDPLWTCRVGGNSDDCDVPACNFPAMTNLSKTNMQASLHVLQSTQNLHGYYMAMQSALKGSGIAAAFGVSDWAWNFYKDKNAISKISLKELVNMATTMVAFFAAWAAPLANSLKILVGGCSAIMAGGFNGVKYKLQEPLANDTPLKAAEIAGKLQTLFHDSLLGLINANDILMAGGNFNGTGDIRDYLAKGAYLNYTGIDEAQVIARYSTLLLSTTINFLYKEQKVWIMGGGPCDDSGGIGKGPQEAKVCRNGKAWYLYFWKEFGGIHLGKKQWGIADSPPGAADLGSGNYANVSIQDIINSSLDAHEVAGLNYTWETFLSRTANQLKEGSFDPTHLGPSWEGLFSIPVCDVGPIVNMTDRNFNKKGVVLTPYGANQVPQWCKPMCANSTGHLDRQTSIDFLNATKMLGFDSFTAYCPQTSMAWPHWYRYGVDVHD
ncbi:MAG: hypothetical protein M1814_005932 [Vezdaea aestivalis]|nr:MAG: hypothetical protein M1814_005932 [Vezdaea aestivalis]